MSWYQQALRQDSQFVSVLSKCAESKRKCPCQIFSSAVPQPWLGAECEPPGAGEGSEASLFLHLARPHRVTNVLSTALGLALTENAWLSTQAFLLQGFAPSAGSKALSRPAELSVHPTNMEKPSSPGCTQAFFFSTSTFCSLSGPGVH